MEKGEYKTNFLRDYPNELDHIKNLQEGEKKSYDQCYASWVFSVLSPVKAQENLNNASSKGVPWTSKCLKCEEDKVINTYYFCGSSYHESWVCSNCHLEIIYNSL